jgi:hypothetical protein
LDASEIRQLSEALNELVDTLPPKLPELPEGTNMLVNSSGTKYRLNKDLWWINGLGYSLEYIFATNKVLKCFKEAPDELLGEVSA